MYRYFMWLPLDTTQEENWRVIVLIPVNTCEYVLHSNKGFMKLWKVKRYLLAIDSQLPVVALLSFIPYLLVRYWQQLQMRRVTYQSTGVPCTFHLASNSLGTRLEPTWLFNACRSNLSDITSSLSHICLSCSCLSLSFSSIVQWCYEGCPTRAETYSWETRLVCTSNL